MIEETRQKAAVAACLNINLHLRDFVADGTGLADSFADYVMLFNLLHAERPEQLLRESFRILKSGGLTVSLRSCIGTVIQKLRVGHR